MIKKIPPQFWFPLWVDKWIFGSMRIEFNPEERSIWLDLMCLATKDKGFIRANEQTPYSMAQLAGMLIYVEQNFTMAIDKFVEKGKLVRDKNGVLYMVNYEKYCGSFGYRRKLKQRHLSREACQDDTHGVSQIKSNQIKLNKIKSYKEKAEKPALILLSEVEIKKKFEELWAAWPSKGRFDRVDCSKKFKSICNKGYYEELLAGVNGYLQMLEIKEKKENFKQNPKYLATFLNMEKARWREYIGIKYKPEN